MSKPTNLRTLFLALLAGLCVVNVPAQDAEVGPPPIPNVLSPEPPDPDTLPPPEPLQWAPLAPKGGEDQSDPVVGGVAPGPEVEISIEPPPPPITEPLDDVPDPAAAALAQADVEVWRDQSIQPQIPPRRPNRLATALVDGSTPVELVAQFDSVQAGKTVYVRPGRGMIIGENDGSRTISSTGACSVWAQLEDGFSRSHITFYCEGVRTVLPIARATQEDVQRAEQSGGGE